MTPTRDQTGPWPGWLPPALAAVALLGAAAFVMGVSGPDPGRAWQIYLVNFIFWTGVSMGGVILAAIWQLASSIWGKAFQGVAVAGAGFLPVCILLFLPLMHAGPALFPWMVDAPAHRAPWMQAGFVFARDGLSLLALFLLAGVFVYYRVRPVVGARWEAGQATTATLVGLPADAFRQSFWAGGWQGVEIEQERSERILRRLAPVLCIVYALVLSLVAFDLVMSLDRAFYSTLFGGYYFFGSLYAGLAWLAVVSVFLFRSGSGASFLTPSFLHPLGKLLFGFCMFHGMLFYSQFLPIWYGNLPEEIEFLRVRSQEPPWPQFSLAFLFLTLLLPFCILLSKPVKQNPRSLAFVAGLVLAGMWLDKYLLIVPSLWHEQRAPFGLLEAAVTAGFAALVMLGYWLFSRYLPLVHFEPGDLRRGH